MDVEKPNVVFLTEAPSSSRSGALVNSIKSIIGSGVMALPFAFSRTGLVPGIAMTLFISFLSFLLNHIISEIAFLQPHAHTIDEVYEGSFGRVGRFAIAINVILHQILACTAYVVFIEKTVGDLTGLSTLMVISCLYPAFAALAFLPTTASLAPFSFMGNIAIFSTLGVVCIYSVFVNSTKGTFTDFELATNIDSVPPFLGVALFMFSGHFEVFTICKSVGSREAYRWVLWGTAGIVTLGYSIFGILVYLAYGTNTNEMVVNHLGPLPRIICVGMLSSALFFSLPLKLTPAVQVVEGYVNQCLAVTSLTGTDIVQPLMLDGEVVKPKPASPRVLCWWQYVCRASLALLACTLAVIVPDFSFLISLIGSVFIGIFAFSLPPFVYLQLLHKHGNCSMFHSVCLVVLGLVGTALAVGTTTFIVLDKVSSH